jgi:hypothetical protein
MREWEGVPEGQECRDEQFPDVPDSSCPATTGMWRTSSPRSDGAVEAQLDRH